MVRDGRRDTEGGTGSDCTSALLDGIDHTVPAGTREAVGALLRRYTVTFSTGENDLGRAIGSRPAPIVLFHRR